jgi:pantetheine-phosphate adenylyltransferase
MRRAACPGTFDPVTHGHLDVVARAARLFDEVVVAVGVNPSKNRLFSAEDRIEMLTEAVAPWGNVVVEGFSGLLTDFCARRDVVAVVKGLRAASDFDYELQMAQMNAALVPGVETVFLPTSPTHSFVSSSLVKEVAGLGGDVSALLPPAVHDRLLAALRRDR